MNTKIWNAISIVEDLRVQGRTTYPLSLILLVTLYAIIGGGGAMIGSGLRTTRTTTARTSCACTKSYLARR